MMTYIYIYFIFLGSLGNQRKHSEYLLGGSLIFESTFGRGYVSSQEGDYIFTLA